MMGKRHVWLSVCIILVIALTVAGCGNGETLESDEGNGKVELQLAIEATGKIPEELQKQIDRFNQKHPKIRVKVRTFSGGDAYNQALMGQVAGGVAPDVFLVDGGKRLKTFAESQAILPLDDIAKEQGVKTSNFMESLLRAFRIDGKLYAIPKDYNTTALFYNKDLLKKEGITPPENWKELKTAAEKLTDGDRFGFGMAPQINYWYPFAKSAGADFVTENKIDLEKLRSEEHVQALNYLQSLFKKKVAASPQMVGAGWEGEMFAKKKVAMVYGGTWIPAVVLAEDPDLQIGAVPLPVKDQKASMLYTAGWVISSKSEHPKESMELISFLTSDEELIKGHEKGLIGLPPTKTAMEKLIKKSKESERLKYFAEIAENGTPFGWMDPKFVDQYNKMMEVLLYKSGQPEKEIQKLKKSIEE